MRAILFIACAAAWGVLHAQDPQWTKPPKLVVGIVVDQMRVDNLYRYWNDFGEAGFKRLVREGSFQRDAHLGYVPTLTGPGHTSIYTGTTPARHGIVANDRYDRATHRTIYCALDTAVVPVGTAAASSKRSPVQLLASTLGDELELRTDRRSRTVGIAIKDRAAILPIGRTGDAAYWYQGGEEGNFVTSSWYMKELPQWVKEFNMRHLAAKYLDQKWDLAMPRERYHTPLPDDNPYEWSLADGIPSSLPVDLASLRKRGADLDLLIYTPWGNTLTTDMAIAAIDGDSLGLDTVPDLLALSYSSIDEIQHSVGQRSIEAEDAYVRLDADLARLFKHLDEKVGEGKYTVFLTADHGGADVPAYLRDLKGSGDYTSMSQLSDWLGVRGFASVIDTIWQDQIYLIADAPSGTDDAVVKALDMNPVISCAISARQLERRETLIGAASAMANGFMPQRCGDVLFAMQPGSLRGTPGSHGRGSTHGSGWNYDTQVPVIFFGQGVLPGEVLRRTSITDVAPTVCAILGMTLPNAADGQVVPEVVRTR